MKSLMLRGLVPLLVFAGLSGAVQAQEIRYSWLDMSYMSQDVGRSGTLPTPGVPDQVVDLDVSDGAGIRFRGSLAVWKNLYIMLDYGSTDIDLTGAVRNIVTGVEVPFADQFDYTAIRGGVGLKFPLGVKTDIYGELTYDSLDFDFGSFAGENFDMSRQEMGGAIGVRHLFGKRFMVEARGRYSGVGDGDLTSGNFDNDTLFGAGFAWEFIRGLSLVGDYESGEFSAWSVGFRFDLDED